MDYDEEDEEDERMLDEKSGLCVSPDNMAGNATRHRDTPNWEGHIISIDKYIYLDYIIYIFMQPDTTNWEGQMGKYSTK